MKALDKEIDSYVDDYNDRIAEEIRRRKALRKERLKHERNITRCNILLVSEAVVLGILIVALIVNVL